MLLSFLLAFSAAHATTPEQVLKTAWSDKTYTVHDSIQDTDSKNPFRDIEAFYSNENDEPLKQEYGLKFHLKSFAEWKTGRSHADQAQVLKESSLAWALRDRYSVILSYELSEQKLKLLETFVDTAEKNLKAMSLSMQAAKASSKNYIEAKDDLMRLQRSKSLLLEEREILKKRLQRWLPESPDPVVDRLDLVSVEDVATGLQSKGTPAQSLTGKLAQEEIAQLDQELKIVKGREDQWFKTIELSQVEKNKDKFVEFGVTLLLPPLGSDDLSKQRQNELILKMALKQRDLENVSDKLQILRFQILNAIELYRSAQANQTLTAKMRVADPMVNLQNKLTSQKEQLDLLNQQQGILTLYLDYLVESETLSKEPGKNYLSKAQKAIL